MSSDMRQSEFPASKEKQKTKPSERL